jgi:peptidoglycan/LPS O-acetylase OafA/YrhL
MTQEDHAAVEAPLAAPRNAGIDLLRGLSILLVVLHHVGLRIPLKRGVLADLLPVRILKGLNYNGYEAVFVFFVLSGFLITTNTLVRWGRLGAVDARAFYARRAARILPCLLLLVAVLAALHLSGAGGYRITRPDQSLPGAVLSALGLYLNWYEGHTGYLPAGWDVLWSLSIEEVFYLGFPLLCLALRRDALLSAVLLPLALSLPITRAALDGNEIWQEKAYLPGMAAIAAGVLAALLVARVQRRPRRLTRLLSVAGGAGLVAIFCFEDKLWPWIGNGTMLVLTLSTVCLVMAFRWRELDGRPWSIRGTAFLRSLGRMSYEVYLTHMFVVLAVVDAFKARGGGMRWGVLWYAPALGFSWLLGWLVARFVSTPIERALRARWTRAAPSSVAPAQIRS